MYKIGDSVRHTKHGVGVVVAVLENMLTILKRRLPHLSEA